MKVEIGAWVGTIETKFDIEAERRRAVALGSIAFTVYSQESGPPPDDESGFTFLEGDRVVSKWDEAYVVDVFEETPLPGRRLWKITVRLGSPR